MDSEDKLILALKRIPFRELKIVIPKWVNLEINGSFNDMLKAHGWNSDDYYDEIDREINLDDQRR